LRADAFANSRGTDAARNETLERARAVLNNDRPQEAEQIVAGILQAGPRHAQALRIRDAALLMQQRAADAATALQAAASGLHDAETDTLLAMALRQCGRAQDALSRLKRALKRRPPYAPAFHELGYLLMSLGRYDEAIDALRRGLDVAPMMPQLSVQLGEVFLRQRSYAAAKTAFARALEIAPDHAEALFGIARAYQALRENAPAADLYRRCLRVRQYGGLAQSRPLSYAARSDRGRPRVLSHRGAPRAQILWHSAYFACSRWSRAAVAEA
jgi:tetratricopeptide (TPR) repeat protein